MNMSESGSSLTLSLGAALRSRPVASAVLRRSLAQAQASRNVLALLVPHHAYSTDTSSSVSTTNAFPPPGFNAEQAKKPLAKAKEQTSEEIEKASEQIQDAIKEIQDTMNQTGPTAEAKTTAQADLSTAELAANKAVAGKFDDKDLAKAEQDQKKLTLWQKIKKEFRHYWDGTKLLGTEAKISSRLALKMAAGYELSRREHRQLQRTTQDLGRLVPFSVFVIVPFAELLLPVALKLFPNLLPSTYEGQKSKDTKAANLRATRKEVSNFLRNTLRETGLPVKAVNTQRQEFTDFFKKVRATGEAPSQEDVIKVCKIFKDDLTLDNLSRPQLVAMTRYMGLNTFGTDAMLRYQIRHRMRQIKRDDKAIFYERVDSLSVPELQMACASRGLRTHGMSPARLREDLQMWLDLRLKNGVPSTLLVLSNAYMYGQGKDTEMTSMVDALQAVLSSIPEELFHEIELEVHNAEGAATNKQRLEVLKEQEELIEEENEQNSENPQEGRSAPKDHEYIDDKEEHKASDVEGRSAEEAEAADAETEADEARNREAQDDSSKKN